jgi:hypothetical protein
MKRSAALLLLALAGCGGEPSDQVAYQGNERKDAETPASFGPDFAELKLGPKIEGSEFEARFNSPSGGRTGTLKGYIACAAELTACDEAGENAVYTYVLEVTPREASSAFRTNERAYGFTGVAGYDKAQARGAIPGDSRLVTLCSDGVLVWAIDGGEGWSRTPITLYWQSTSLPSDTSKSYVLITDGVRSTATAPFPTEGSTDKCR